MKSKSKKQIFREMAAVLVLICFQLPFAPSSSGAFYDRGRDTQTIWNPGGYPDGEGRGIPHAFWTSAGTYYFLRIDLLGLYDNNQVYGSYFDNRQYMPTFASDFSSDMAAYFLKGKLALSTDIGGGQGRWWGATSDADEKMQDMMEPIPSVAWLFALGIIGLVALKRRRKRG